jgi:hypothetical protein
LAKSKGRVGHRPTISAPDCRCPAPPPAPSGSAPSRCAPRSRPDPPRVRNARQNNFPERIRDRYSVTISQLIRLLSIAVAISWAPVRADDLPSGPVAALENAPISAVDFGLYRLQERLNEEGFDASVYSLSDGIGIGVLDEFDRKATDLPDELRYQCERGLNNLRLKAGVDPKSGDLFCSACTISSFARLFGTEKATLDVLKALDKIFRVRYVMTERFGDNSSSIVCTGNLLSSSITFE